MNEIEIATAPRHQRDSGEFGEDPTPDVSGAEGLGTTPFSAAPTIAEQIGALEIECKYRLLKVRQSNRMKEITQLMTLDLRGDIVKASAEIRGLKQLTLASEARLRELIAGHLLELRNIRDLPRLIQMRSHYQHREWSYLKATFPTLFREADAEAERFERHLTREVSLERRAKQGSR
jgi:hypothetical protein